jgi:hypothetical protein
MDMPIADNTFDAAYALQATCHAPDAVCLAPYFCQKPSLSFRTDSVAHVSSSTCITFSEVPTVRSTEC